MDAANMDAQHSTESSTPELLGESPPEHGLPGRALILLIHAAGLAGFLALLADAGSWSERLGLLPFACILPLSTAFLADALRRFECWAWFFVMGTLGLTLFFMVMIALFDAPLQETVGVWGAFVLIAGWMRYLWSHRRPFWADPPTRQSRHRPERWVTPEWRAARLARIADGSGGFSFPAQSRPETVHQDPA